MSNHSRVLAPLGAAVLALLAIQSCNAPPRSVEQRPISKGAPNESPIAISNRNETCQSLDHRLPPSEAELASFESRRRNGRVVKPIEVGCIQRVYGDKKIADWVSSGDVVARYASLLSRSHERGVVCKSFAEEDKELSDIASIRIEKSPRSTLARIPEAYVSQAYLRLLCQKPGAEAAMREAAQAGYDTESLSSFYVD